MKSVLTFFFLLLINASFGQVTNVKTGVWSDLTIWNNHTLPTDTTNIVLSYDIIIDINASCKSLHTNGHKVTVQPGITFNVIGNNKVVIDIDGNVYNTVTIGRQVWMKENLDVSHYRNGDPIPQVQDSTVWGYLTTGAWCYYQNNTANGTVYGKLYNWYAVNDPRGLAPEGWHVPSDSEWITLTDYLGGPLEAGGRIKEAGTTHWLSPNSGADNSTGFTGLPGGFRRYDGVFLGNGDLGGWWSSTKLDTLYVLDFFLTFNLRDVTTSSDFRLHGYSVRCINNTINNQSKLHLYSVTPSHVTKSTAISGGNITDAGSSPIIVRGVCWNKSGNPTVSDNKTNDGSGAGIFTSNITGLDSNTSYYVRAYAINSTDTAFGNQLTFSTVQNQEFITIGTQTWMTTNLNVSTYGNGDTIPQVKDSVVWQTLTTGAWCYYGNNSGNGTVYGKLYNWYAMNDPRRLAPVGWHVPSDLEWTKLTDYLGGLLVAGGKMKETGTSHWVTPNTGADNASGFLGLPGGTRNRQPYNFASIGYTASWWSDTTFPGDIYFSSARSLSYSSSNVIVGGVIDNSRSNGYSVRCIKDTILNQPSLLTIPLSSITKISAVSGGNVFDNGGSSIVARGVCWNKSGNPTVSDNKTNDGSGLGSFKSNILGLDSNTTYYMRSYAVNNTNTAYGNQFIFTTEGNLESVTIGTQTWKLKNLDMVTYRNGDTIPEVQDSATWASLTTGAWCYYQNNSAYGPIYGKLYNWYAVNDPRGLAPSGWHIPSDAEWITLTNFIGTTLTGGKMKEAGTNHWLSPNISADNSSGFTALPGGFRVGAFKYIYTQGSWWSSSIDSNTEGAWIRTLGSNYATIYRDPYYKYSGLSVRCVRD